MAKKIMKHDGNQTLMELIDKIITLDPSPKTAKFVKFITVVYAVRWWMVGGTGSLALPKVLEAIQPLLHR